MVLGRGNCFGVPIVLLYCRGNSAGKFIVAYDCREFNGEFSWRQAHYFDDLKPAINQFMNYETIGLRRLV